MIKARKIEEGSRITCNNCYADARSGVYEYTIQGEEDCGGFGFCLCNSCAAELVAKLSEQINKD